MRSASTYRPSVLRSLESRLLRARGQGEAADLLLSLPFDLWDATNSFHDDFAVLYAELPMDQYVAIADRQADAHQLAFFRQIANALAETDIDVRFIAVSLGDDSEPMLVASPSPKISSDVLEQALADVERSLAAGRPASGIDRVHTALHAYLQNLARDTGLAHENSSIPELFKTLRQNHPTLRPTGPRAADLTRVLNGIATIVDALNPLRNKASLAHPTDELLGEPEAMLAINPVRTLLHYFEKKVR